MHEHRYVENSTLDQTKTYQTRPGLDCRESRPQVQIKLQLVHKNNNRNATNCQYLNKFRILFSITLCRISSKTIKYFQRFLFFAAETRLAQKHFCAKVYSLFSTFFVFYCQNTSLSAKANIKIHTKNLTVSIKPLLYGQGTEYITI